MPDGNESTEMHMNFERKILSYAFPPLNLPVNENLKKSGHIHTVPFEVSPREALALCGEVALAAYQVFLNTLEIHHILS